MKQHAGTAPIDVSMRNYMPPLATRTVKVAKERREHPEEKLNEEELELYQSAGVPLASWDGWHGSYAVIWRMRMEWRDVGKPAHVW